MSYYETEAPVSLSEMARSFVEKCSIQQFPEAEYGTHSGGLYARCIRSLADAALIAAKDKDPDTFRWDYLGPIGDFVDSLLSAVTDDASRKPWFWQHDSSAVQTASQGKAPPIDRMSIEMTVDEYLALPVRSALVDRTLVDILLATEVFAFASEVHNQKYSYSRISFVKGNGPIGFLMWRGISALFYSAAAVAAAGLNYVGILPDGWWDWIVGILIALFALESLWAIIKFPSAWLAQTRINKKIREILSIMAGVYAEMNTSGAISAKHVQKRAQDASASGVGWPAPLFVLLDDIIDRGGKM